MYKIFDRNGKMNQKIKAGFIFFNIVIVFFLVGVFLTPVGAQMSHEEMLRMADQARGNEEGVRWDVSMHSIEKGRKQYRKMRVTAKGYNALINTLAPKNVRGQKFLMLDRNMWFSQPGLSKPVPISPRQKLLGTAANGDIASTNYGGDYKITGTEDGNVGGEACVVMHLQAVDNRATYDRIKYWVSRDRLLGLKAEFYTVSGKMFKKAIFEYGHTVMINDKPREFISGMIITSAIIKDDITTVSYSEPLLQKVPDATFNINLMTR